MNYYIEYLTETDIASTGYRGYRRDMNSLNNRIRTKSLHELLFSLNQISTDSEAAIITFLSHSFTGYDSAHQEVSGLILDKNKQDLILWRELIDVANNCRTKYPLTLNLLTPCNSYKILNSIKNFDRIDRIWYSKVENPTVRYSVILAEECKSFNEFTLDFLSDDEQGNFGEWIKPYISGI
jgi:hypothetical protein